VLFNNGGIMVPPHEQLTVDGYDLQFGTNVLGHFYLTRLLLPTLVATAKNSLDGRVRVVTTASGGAMFHAYIDWETLKDGDARKAKDTQKLYFQSKYGNIVFAQELARKYEKDGIIATSLNPGNLNTDLSRHIASFKRQLISYLVWPAHMGAITPLWVGTSPEGADLSGKYLIPWARVGPIPYGADDPALGERLWTWMEEQVKGI